jgi:hypothetical protein
LNHISGELSCTVIEGAASISRCIRIAFDGGEQARDAQLK